MLNLLVRKETAKIEKVKVHRFYTPALLLVMKWDDCIKKRLWFKCIDLPEGTDADRAAHPRDHNYTRNLWKPFVASFRNYTLNNGTEQQQ
jgi:hypothetical protein